MYTCYVCGNTNEVSPICKCSNNFLVRKPITELPFHPEYETYTKQRKWDLRFLDLARSIAAWSRDPSTKCGAVIVDGEHGIVSTGYNGFARGVVDSEAKYADREGKLERVVHAEVNSILRADRSRLSGSTLYTWPFSPCSRCAAIVCQAGSSPGIIRCVAPPMPADKADRWAANMQLAAEQFAEAGIVLDYIAGEASGSEV